MTPTREELIEWLKVHGDELKDMMEGCVKEASPEWHKLEGLRTSIYYIVKYLERDRLK